MFCCMFFLTFFVSYKSLAYIKREDEVLGEWINEEKTLIISVYKQHSDFKAKIIWFRDHDNKKKPMASRLDSKNPNKELRSLKIIGSDVLRNLTYNEITNRWEHGVIYDATSGKEWESSAWITKDGILHVRAYWRFELIGRSLVFHKIK